MSLVSLSGQVSHINQISTTSGTIRPDNSFGGGGTITTSHKTTFRIAGRPVEMKGVPSLGEGDFASAVGVERSGTLYPLAFRNDSTNIEILDNASYFLSVFTGIIGILLGGGSGSTAIALFFLIPAGWLYYKTKTKKKFINEASGELRGMTPVSA